MEEMKGLGLDLEVEIVGAPALETEVPVELEVPTIEVQVIEEIIEQAVEEVLEISDSTPTVVAVSEIETLQVEAMEEISSTSPIEFDTDNIVVPELGATHEPVDSTNIFPLPTPQELFVESVPESILEVEPVPVIESSPVPETIIFAEEIVQVEEEVPIVFVEEPVPETLVFEEPVELAVVESIEVQEVEIEELAIGEQVEIVIAESIEVGEAQVEELAQPETALPLEQPLAVVDASVEVIETIAVPEVVVVESVAQVEVFEVEADAVEPVETTSSTAAAPIETNATPIDPSVVLPSILPFEEPLESSSSPPPPPPPAEDAVPNLTMTLYTVWNSTSWAQRIPAIVASVAINFGLPFINGVMLGFGELFAKNVIATRLGWSSPAASPSASTDGRANTSSLGLRAAGGRPSLGPDGEPRKNDEAPARQ